MIRKELAFVLLAAILGCSISGRVCLGAEGYAFDLNSGETVSENVTDKNYISWNGTIFENTEQSISMNAGMGKNQISDNSLDNVIILGEEENFQKEPASEENESISSNGEMEEAVDEDNLILDISGNDIVLDEKIPETEDQDKVESLSENAFEDKEEVEQEHAIIKVEMPIKTCVHMDPENRKGKGQLFSEVYEVVNYSNRDVLIRIKDVSIIYKFKQDLYEFSEKTVADDSSDTKKISLDMVWANKEEKKEKVLNISDGITKADVLCLKAAEYDHDEKFAKLNKGSRGGFYFTGSLNSYLGTRWVDGEISINFDYQVIDMNEDDGDTEEVNANEDVIVEEKINEEIENEEGEEI